jgi:Fe-S-cluster containining protein
MAEFTCTSCGLCCHQVDKIIGSTAPFAWMQQATDDFPYQAREDGSCEKLEDNQCTVYDDRPLLCDIGRMAKEPDIPINEETWFNMNYIGCKQLQMEIVA